MRLLKNIVALYRPIAGLPVERQREMCKTAAHALGLKIGTEYVAGEDGITNRDWLNGVTPRDIAMVANLLVIPEPRAKGNRPVTDLGAILAAIAQVPAMAMSAAHQVSSADGGKWIAVVREAYNSLAAGKRKLRRAEAKGMAAKSVASRKRKRMGAVKRWKSKGYAHIRAQHAPTWRDPVHKNDDVAFRALPDDVKSDIGSVMSARRIFGRRTVGKTRAGRPKKIR